MIVGDPSQAQRGEYGGLQGGGLISGATRLLSLQHRIRLDRRMRAPGPEGGAADAAGGERDGAAGGSSSGGDRGGKEQGGGSSGASKVAADEFDIKLFQQKAKQAELARYRKPYTHPYALPLLLPAHAACSLLYGYRTLQVLVPVP